MARPRLQLDEATIEHLAQCQCTQAEIADAVGCSVDTLTRRFADTLTRCKAHGKTRLRARQFRRAMKGSDSMLIFLGKQYLGQSDKTTMTSLTELPDPVDAYARDPALMARGLQFERDLANATAPVPIDPGPPGVPGVEVPAPYPKPGGNGNGIAGHAPDQPPDCPSPG